MENQKPSQAGRIVLTVLLCIVLFFSAVGTTLLADLHTLTQKDNLQNLINKILVGSAPHSSIRVGGLTVGQPTAYAAPDGDTQNLLSELVDTYFDQFSQEYEIPVSREEIKAMLNDSTLPEFLSEKTASIISDLMNGEHTTEITRKEVEDLLAENKEKLEALLGGEIPAELTEGILNWTEENGSSMVEQLESVFTGTKEPGVDVPDGTNPDGTVGGSIALPPLVDMGILAAVRAMASTKSLVTGIAICAVLSVLVLLVNRKALAYGLCSNGITYLVAGLLSALPYFVGPTVASFLPAPFDGVVELLLSFMFKPSLYVIALGGGLLVISIVWGIIARIVKKEHLQPMPGSPEL